MVASGPEIARRRMRAQQLWGRPLASIEAVVRSLGAMQAQEYAFAKWSVAQRARVDDDAVERAFAEGRILRTHVLRPTWHFVLPDDIRWLLQVTAPRVLRRMATPYRQLGLDGGLLAKASRAIAKALDGGDHLTRNEIGRVLESAGIEAEGQRLGFIVMRAELDAVICSGPRRGKQHTYALLDERAPRARVLDPDDALAEMTRRYFTGHGPATVKDLCPWATLTLGDARRGLEMVEGELERQDVDGRTYWFAPRVRRAPAATGRFDLVQVYDETIMGYTDSRDAMFDRSAEGRVPAYEEAWMHAILLDGRLIGRWKPEATRSSVAVRMTTFRRLTRAEDAALDEAIGRYSAFRGLPVARAG